MDAHKVELGPRVRPRLMVVLPQTLSVWGSCFLSGWITKVSRLYGPRVCPRLMVALSQTVGWAVAFILMDHKGK